MLVGHRQIGGKVTARTVRLNVKRQNNPDSKPYREEFELRWRPGMNVIMLS